MKAQIEDQANIVRKWLSATGDSWHLAVRDASCLLLNDYLQRWPPPRMVPVELHRLAYTLNSSIERIENMSGKAALLPFEGGFQIIINANLPARTYRSSVAHELAHTVFYTSPIGHIPKRLIKHHHREEYFCYDVARHLLAPKEHLDILGVFSEDDPSVIYRKLGYLNLSRAWSARIMLADYRLATGIAGRWVHKEDKWQQVYPGSTASPHLSADDRKKLRKLASRYLETRELSPDGINIIVDPTESENSIFVIVTTKINELKLFI